MFRLKLLMGFVGILLSSVSACAQPTCEVDNEDLRAMPKIGVVFVRVDGSQLKVAGKLADNNATRAAGFQRVCEKTIESTPILFDFQQASMPRFHMNNVVAPIDIAFIDKDGKIESIHHMKPYVLGSNKKPLYGPGRPIVAAVEVHRGFFEEHGLGLDSRVVWHVAPGSYDKE